LTPAAGVILERRSGSNFDAELHTDDKILVLVHVALGTGDVEHCHSGDTDGDGSITVDEIVDGLRRAPAGR